jgi:hypothetical protein
VTLELQEASDVLPICGFVIHDQNERHADHSRSGSVGEEAHRGAHPFPIETDGMTQLPRLVAQMPA